MYVPIGDVSTNNTHANMISKQRNRQAGKQASEQSSGARQAEAKLMYNTKCYHARRDYRSQHS